MFIDQITKCPRQVKITIVILCDVVLLPLALWSAVALRLGTLSPNISGYFFLFFLVPIFSIPLLYLLGLYRAVIRYANDKLMFTVVSGVSVSVLLLAAIVYFAEIKGIPRSSIIIYGVFACFYIVTSRYIARALLGKVDKPKSIRQDVAIYGAGQAGTQTALALFSGNQYNPVAFFDDNKDLVGRSILGVRVFDPTKAMSILGTKNCTQLLLAIPSASRSRRRQIIEGFEGKGLVLKTIPGMGDLVDGKVRVEDIREVGVEDLLGRDPVPPVESLYSKCIQGKVVMVTGAGGSIGSELCRQILKANPKALILLELNEFALYKVEQELSSFPINTVIVPILGDVGKKVSIVNLLKKFEVDTIYHAAAYKHVPLIESNVISGVLNNTFGTLALAEASIEANVDTFVLVSTDKAVRPTNVMGTTKRLSEMILQAFAEKQKNTRFCMVRFGNVLGSSGSVIPLFKQQIRNGGPVTVTHSEVTRYFMTIPEASQLVIQAGAMGRGGDVFVLDMGEPVKIVDLAKRLIEFSGLNILDSKTGFGDIAIKTIGLRPGEKLYEELLIGDNVEPTEHPRIMSAKEHFIGMEELSEMLERLRLNCESGNIKGVIETLKLIVPEFQKKI